MQQHLLRPAPDLEPAPPLLGAGCSPAVTPLCSSCIYCVSHCTYMLQSRAFLLVHTTAATTALLLHHYAPRAPPRMHRTSCTSPRAPLCVHLVHLYVCTSTPAPHLVHISSCTSTRAPHLVHINSCTSTARAAIACTSCACRVHLYCPCTSCTRRAPLLVHHYYSSTCRVHLYYSCTHRVHLYCSCPHHEHLYCSCTHRVHLQSLSWDFPLRDRRHLSCTSCAPLRVHLISRAPLVHHLHSCTNQPRAPIKPIRHQEGPRPFR